MTKGILIAACAFLASFGVQAGAIVIDFGASNPLTIGSSGTASGSGTLSPGQIPTPGASGFSFLFTVFSASGPSSLAFDLNGAGFGSVAVGSVAVDESVNPSLSFSDVLNAGDTVGVTISAAENTVLSLGDFSIAPNDAPPVVEVRTFEEPVTPQAVAIPEPGTLALAALGLLGAAALRRRA